MTWAGMKSFVLPILLVLLFASLAHASRIAVAQPSNDFIFVPMGPEPAATPISPDADPSIVVPLILRALDAIERKDYAIAVGLALMAVTFLAIRIPTVRSWIPRDYTATALLGISTLSGFGVALASGVPSGRAAVAFLVCSAVAIAFWEGVAKHLVKAWHKLTTPEGGPP